MNKEFKELTITVDFVFSAISGNPENIVMIRRFIEVILGREIKEIHRHRRLRLFRHSALACF